MIHQSVHALSIDQSAESFPLEIHQKIPEKKRAELGEKALFGT